MYISSNCIVLLPFLCLFYFVDSLGPSNTGCTPRGLCQCIFPNNEGINLKKLTPTPLQVVISNDTSLFVNPCSDINYQNGTDCQSTAICLKKTDFSHNVTWENLGSVKNGKLILERIADIPVLVYEYNDWSTKILLYCGSSSPDLSLKEHSNNSFVLQLSASGGCVEEQPSYGPSKNYTGMIALIILIIFLLYLVGGYLVLRFIRGAEGVEAIPNHQFWLSIPTKLKSGVLFLVNGCQSPTTYDRI